MFNIISAVIKTLNEIYIVIKWLQAIRDFFNHKFK